MLPRGVDVFRIMRLHNSTQLSSAMRRNIHPSNDNKQFDIARPRRSYCNKSDSQQSTLFKKVENITNEKTTQNAKSSKSTKTETIPLNTELLRAVTSDKAQREGTEGSPTYGKISSIAPTFKQPSKDVLTTAVKSSTANATSTQLVKETSDSARLQSNTNIPDQSRMMKIKTSKGVLSVTTTIEDSKINDIIFEKVKPMQSSQNQQQQKQQQQPKPTLKLGTDTSTEESSKTLTAANDLITASTAKLRKDESNRSQELKDSKDSLAKPTKAALAFAVGATVGANSKPEPDVKKKILKVDLNRSSMERNFVTPSRAMADFLLKASDLEQLPKIKRRSPYEQEPPITVYWRKDVEAKAIEVWGSRENMLAEKLKREVERKKHQQNIFTVKRRLRDYRREMGARAVVMDDEPGLKGKSGRVVLTAIGINAVNFLFKLGGWLYTGSHSMFSEAIHSLADTINQMILAYGIHKSVQSADSDHPYGYSNMKYVSSLISGVGIFCVGAGVSYYHGITGLLSPEPMQDFFWAFFILGGSLVSESATLVVALGELRRSAKLQGVSLKDYVLSGKDPSVNVVLTEDAAAVTSVGVAATCMGLSSLTGSSTFDALGSLLVGTILGVVASFIIFTNVAALVGKSIPQENLDKINAELENDLMIRAIHDVKGIDMGNSLVRYKAELDFDGRELSRIYLEKQDLNEFLRTVKSFETVEELEEFLLKHGENIVDLLGGEIDRIEMRLRKNFPEIRHCDLEIL